MVCYAALRSHSTTHRRVCQSSPSPRRAYGQPLWRSEPARVLSDLRVAGPARGRRLLLRRMPSLSPVYPPRHLIAFQSEKRRAYQFGRRLVTTRCDKGPKLGDPAPDTPTWVAQRRRRQLLFVGVAEAERTNPKNG